MSVTTDVFTDESTRVYPSLTVHFVDENCNFRSELLACSQLDGKHTAYALSRFLLDTAKKFGVLNKILFVCVDNASNDKASLGLTASEHAVFWTYSWILTSKKR